MGWVFLENLISIYMDTFQYNKELFNYSFIHSYNDIFLKDSLDLLGMLPDCSDRTRTESELVYNNKTIVGVPPPPARNNNISSECPSLKLSHIVSAKRAPIYHVTRAFGPQAVGRNMMDPCLSHTLTMCHENEQPF